MSQTRERRMYLYWKALKKDRDYIHSLHKGWLPKPVMMVARTFGVPIREVRDILYAQKGPESMALSEKVDEAHHHVKMQLTLFASNTANDALAVLGEAVLDGDAEAIRTEGNSWSGRIGLDILELADMVEKLEG